MLRLVPILLLLAACSTVGTGVRVLTHSPSQEASAVPSGTYEADPDHTAVSFKVEHLGFSSFVARFHKVEATLAYDNQDPTQSQLEVVVTVDSIDVKNETLRGLLLGKDFFDSTRHPELRFVAESIALTGDASGDIIGTLTMAGKSRPATLAVTFNGAANNPLTRTPTLGFSAQSIIERSNWGLGNWRPAVTDEVRIDIEIEFAREVDG